MTHRLSRSLLVAGLFASAVAAQAQLNPPVDIGSQLMITDLRVVEDPIRTNPRNGPQAT